MTQFVLAFSIGKNLGGINMTKVERMPSFGNLHEWLEGFEYEPSPQMRQGMLKALFYDYNFHDTKGLNPNNKLLYIIRALSVSNVTDQTIEYGFDLAMGRILWRRPVGKWPDRVRKETLFQFLRFLETKCYRKNLDPIHLRMDYVQNFVESMVRAYDPKNNTRAENSLIMRTVFARGDIRMFTQSGWFGCRIIIRELLKKFPNGSIPFADGKWHRYSTELAIHLARAGELDEAVNRLLKR